jgi:hypothetical protein
MMIDRATKMVSCFESSLTLTGSTPEIFVAVQQLLGALASKKLLVLEDSP